MASHRLLNGERPVGIPHHESQAFGGEILLHLLKGQGDRAAQPGIESTVVGAAKKVVGVGITQFKQWSGGYIQ